MSGISSSQGSLSTQQPIVDTVSDPRGGATGNLTNVRNSGHQPTSVNNPQSTEKLNEGQFTHLQNFVRQGLGFKPQNLIYEGLKSSKAKKNNAIRQEQEEKLKSNASKFVNEFFNNGALIDLTDSQENIINNDSFVKGFKLDSGFAEFLLQDGVTSNIMGEHLHLFVKIDGDGYVSSEDVPYDTPVSTNARADNLANSRLSEGEPLNPDDVKSHNDNEFSIPETNSNRFRDGEKTAPHPEGTTSNTTNIFNNDNRVINNHPIYTQNNFKFSEPDPKETNLSFQPEKIFVAGYDPAQKTMAQHLPENLTYPGEQSDGAKNIVKNLRAVTDVGPSQPLSDSSAESVDQPDGLTDGSNRLSGSMSGATVQVDGARGGNWPPGSMPGSTVQTDGIRGSNHVTDNPEASSAVTDGANRPSESMSGATVQTDGTRGGNRAAVQTDGTRGGNRAAVQTDGTRGGNHAAVQTDGTRGGNRAAVQTDGIRGGNHAAVQSDGTRGGNHVTDNPEASSAVTDGANRLSGSMSGATVQTDGARGGNHAADNREASVDQPDGLTDGANRPSSAATNAAQQPSGNTTGAAAQKGGYQQVTENGKTSWVKVGQGNPPLFLSDGGRSYRGMVVPRNSMAAGRPSLSAASSGASGSAATDAIQQSSGSMSGSMVQIDGAHGGNHAAVQTDGTRGGNRAAVQTDGTRGGNRAAVQTDGVRGGNHAADNRKARFAIMDGANRLSGSMSGATVQADGTRGGNRAADNRKARSAVMDGANRPSSAATNAAQPPSGSTTGPAVQKGGYQQVTENGKTSWVKVGQGNPPLFLSDGGRSYRGMVVPRDSMAAGRPNLSAASSGASGSAATDAVQQSSGSNARQMVQADGARGGTRVADNRKARSAVMEGANRPSSAATNAAQPPSGNATGPAAQKGGYQQVTENGKTSWVKVGQGNPPLFLSDGGRSYRGMVVPRDSTAAGRPSLSAASSGASGSAATDAVQQSSGSNARQTVQSDGTRGGNHVTDNPEARSAVMDGANRPSSAATNTAQQPSGSTTGPAAQKGGYQQVTENGKTSWIKVGQGNQPMVNLSEAGVTYRRMDIPNVKAKNFN